MRKIKIIKKDNHGIFRDTTVGKVYIVVAESSIDNTFSFYDDINERVTAMENEGSEWFRFVKDKAPKPKKVKHKPPVLKVRKVALEYDNYKHYHLTNVISFLIDTREDKVKITYDQMHGKVKHIHNIIIPFSELHRVTFKSPENGKTSFIFVKGKLVSQHEFFDIKQVVAPVQL